MSIPPGDYSIAPPKVSFSWLSNGWDYFKAKSDVWLVVGLLAGLVSLVLTMILVMPDALYIIRHSGNTNPNPFGLGKPGNILQGYITSIAGGAANCVLAGCMLRLALLQIRREEINAGKFFAVGTWFIRLAGIGCISGLIKATITLPTTILDTGMLGSLHGLSGYIGLTDFIPNSIVDGLLMFAPLFVVDRNMNASNAISASFGMLKNQWLMAAVFSLVCSFLMSVSFLACCIGSLVVWPLVILGITFGYLTLTQTMPQFQEQYYPPEEPGTWPPPPKI